MWFNAFGCDCIRNCYVVLQSCKMLLPAQVIEVWVAILQAVPTSRLLIKNKPFACPTAREHVLQQFVQLDIAAHRIDLLPLAPANSGVCLRQQQR